MTEKITCVPRRHISNSAFKTYDAMVAMCGGTTPMTCYASATKIANWNNRNVDAEYAGLAELEREGWIVPTHDAPRRKSRAGTFTTNEYRVLTHDEFLAAHPDSCPPPKYDEKGHPIKKQERAPRSLERANLRRFFGERTRFLGELGDQLLDAIADAIHAKKSTVTDNPVTVTRTVTESSVATVTENPVTTATENSVTSLDVKPEKKSTDRQPTQPSTTPQNGRADRTASSLTSSSLKDDQQWQEFLKEAKDESSVTSGWVMYGESLTKVRTSVETYGGDAVMMAVEEWAEKRRPPVSGLDYPWLVFLREAGDEVRAYAAAFRKDRERRAAKKG